MVKQKKWYIIRRAVFIIATAFLLNAVIMIRGGKGEIFANLPLTVLLSMSLVITCVGVTGILISRGAK